MKTAEQIYHNIETGVIDVSNEVGNVIRGDT